MYKTLHIVFALILGMGLSMPVAHAGVVSTFTSRVKTIFLGDEADTEEATPTSQTITLPRSLVVEDTDSESQAQTNDAITKEKDVLQVTSGPMRFSTEDIDFPVTDEISLYEVKKGDSLASVAKLFNVSKNTIIWANDLKSQTISPGDTLLILPITGIKHTIKKGETVSGIARKYKADADDIAKYNGVAVDGKLSIGDILIVPDGEIAIVQNTKPKSSKSPRILNSYAYSAPSGFFIRPVVGARKTQGIHGHNGVDFGATPGTPILASASGRIIVAKSGGYNGGYGSMIIIAHDGGIQTLYAHLRAVYVTQGQTVSQGDVIGEVGNTGRSTGPHLHFEIRGAKNPF